MRRTIGFVLVLVLLILPSKAVAQEPVTIAVPDVTVKAGETLELVMSVRNSPGISGAGITVTYDEQAMRLTDIVSLTSGSFLKDIDRSNFSWLKGNDLTGDFDLVKLCFEISDSASGTYTVGAGSTGDLAANITNQNAIPVPVVFVSGTVTAEKKVVPGGGASGGGMGGAGGGAADESTDPPVVEEPAETVFKDVAAEAYYSEAVLWAIKNGITTGTSATTFSPDVTCTRAQTVTFLWRAAGSPEPKSAEVPFEDIAAEGYYYKAVLWAVENGITSGTTDTTFSPNDECTRAQIVTFLWRSQKAPAAGAVNPFTDVAADTYYNDAVLWAGEKGITFGTSATTFSPDNDCTRAQIVTFLYRCMSK